MEPGDILYEKRNLMFGEDAAPKVFAISSDYMVYVPDSFNRRINVYDINMNFIRTILEKVENRDRQAHGSYNLMIDKLGNIISLTSDGIEK